MNTLRGGERETVHLHALCWNEARMIPYFFRHYRGLVDRFFIYDTGSNDGSRALLAGDERVQVVTCELDGKSIFGAERDIAEQCWKTSRGSAEWVFLVDIAEHLHHPDLPRILQEARRAGATAIKTVGYEMVADHFPDEPEPLTALVTRGLRLAQRDRFAVFDPDAIEATNFAIGRLSAEPAGRVAWDIRHPLALLNYERLGLDYVAERHGRLAARLREDDARSGYGVHYRMSRASMTAQHLAMTRAALPVPLLVAGTVSGDIEAGKARLRESGLFQDAWYLKQNPDVAEAGLDPLDHFCRNGWREGRRPNPLFDPGWYLSAYGELIGDVNPLLDYATEGEALGRKPAPDFDPMDYRFRHGLATTESPLRHRLLGEAASG